MIIFKRMLNLYRFSYFKLAILAGLLVAMLFAGGCNRQAQSGALGSLAGIAQLSAPDATTGHAGILVFLAGTPYQARTDQQGRYRIDGIPAGTYDLVAEKDGYQGQVIQDLLVNPVTNTPEQPLQPSSPMLTRIVAAPPTTGTTELGTIKGVAYLDGMDVNENGGIRVEVNGTAFVTVSSNEGQYRILNVEPGTYALSYYKDGYRPFTTEDISVTTGTTEVPVVALELVQAGDRVSAASAAAAAAIKATTPTEPEAAPPGPDEKRNIVGLVDLRDAQNQPITDYSNVTVAINGSDQVAEVNEQGQFRIDNLTSGTYTLIGAVTDGPVVQLPVDLETQRTATVTVKLGGPATAATQAGGIKGKVVLLDPDEKPIPDASGVQVAVNGTQVIATTTADGTFTLKGVDAGTYTITANKDTFETAEVPDVAVTAAAPVDVGEIRMAMKVDRPRVISTTPANNAKDVEVGYDLPIIIKFSDRMDATSVREAIKLSPSTPFTVVIGKGSDPAADDNTLVIRLSNEDEKAPN